MLAMAADLRDERIAIGPGNAGDAVEHRHERLLVSSAVEREHHLVEAPFQAGEKALSKCRKPIGKARSHAATAARCWRTCWRRPKSIGFARYSSAWYVCRA